VASAVELWVLDLSCATTVRPRTGGRARLCGPCTELLWLAGLASPWGRARPDIGADL
jgi:hypothetical protein